VNPTVCSVLIKIEKKNTGLNELSGEFIGRRCSVSILLLDHLQGICWYMEGDKNFLSQNSEKSK